MKLACGSFSQPGKQIDVFAPAVDIESAGNRSPDDKVVLSGNSPAAALVAGSLAGYLAQFSGAQAPVTMRKWLLEHTLPVELVLQLEDEKQQQDLIPFLYVPYLLASGNKDKESTCHPLKNIECLQRCFVPLIVLCVILLFFIVALIVVGRCALRYFKRKLISSVSVIRNCIYTCGAIGQFLHVAVLMYIRG